MIYPLFCCSMFFLFESCDCCSGFYEEFLPLFSPLPLISGFYFGSCDFAALWFWWMMISPVLSDFDALRLLLGSFWITIVVSTSSPFISHWFHWFQAGADLFWSCMFDAILKSLICDLHFEAVCSFRGWKRRIFGGDYLPWLSLLRSLQMFLLYMDIHWGFSFDSLFCKKLLVKYYFFFFKKCIKIV